MDDCEHDLDWHSCDDWHSCEWEQSVRVGERGSKYAVIYECYCGATWQPMDENDGYAWRDNT